MYQFQHSLTPPVIFFLPFLLLSSSLINLRSNIQCKYLHFKSQKNKDYYYITPPPPPPPPVSH